MDHTPPPPPPPCTTAIPVATSGSSSPSSAMLGLSSSAHSHRRHRFSPSLYPSPAPPLPGRLASSGPGSGSSSSGSSSRFQQHVPPPPPSPLAAGAGRPEIKRGLPTPFLSELCAIRRLGASLFGDLETRATAAAAVQRNATRSAAPLLGRWQQPPPPPPQHAWAPSPTASRVAGTPTLLPSRSFSELAPPVPRQPSSCTGMPPLPCPSFSGSWNAPPPASQQQQAPQPSSTDLTAPVHGRSFSGGFAPPALQPSFTDLAPVPSESFSLGFMWTRHSETTSASSSWSAPPGSGSDTMYLDAQPLLSDSQLQPLPQSLQMQSDGIMMPFCQPSAGNNNGTSGFVQPAASSSGSERFELGHDAMPMTRQDTPPLFQVKQEPIDVPAPWVQPELISVDDDDDDVLSALLHSLKSSSEPASLTTLEPTSTQDMLQMGGSGSGPSAWATVEGSYYSWEEAMLLTPAATTLDNVVNTGGNNTSGSSGIPWNCHMSMPQQQAPHMGEQFCSLPASSDIAAQWQTSQSNTSESLFVQPQPNLQHPSSTDRLQLNSSHGPSVWSTANSSGQGCSAMPAALLASKFGQMSIDGGSMNAIGQGWHQATTPPAASNFDMFGVSGSSTSAGATMPWNFSSSSMEQYASPVPNLRLEKSRLAPRQPSLDGAGASMLRSGAHGDFFSEDEMRTINKEKRLRELVNTDPKRVKRILSNRVSAAQLKARKANYALDLQHRAEALNMEYLSLFTQVQSHQERYVDLKTQNSKMQVKLQVLNEQASLKEALNRQLRSEIQRLKLLDELNMLRANGLHNTVGSQMAGENGWYVDDLQQLVDSHSSDASVSNQMPTQEQPPQYQQQQPHHAIDNKLVMGEQQLPCNF